MKRFVSIVLFLVLTLSATCLADKNVTINPAGKQTKDLSYKIVDSGIDYWTDSIGTKHAFSFIAIKNTEKDKAIYLDTCHFDYEDDNGQIADNQSWTVSKAPDVINPGETGYFYVSSMNTLDDTVDLSKGLNLVAQFSLKEASEELDSYDISETKLSWKKQFNDRIAIIRGRITNNTDEDDSMADVVVVLKDSNKKVLWIQHTYVHDLFSGSTLGFDISMSFATPKLKKGAVKSFKTIAKPEYYQW